MYLELSENSEMKIDTKFLETLRDLIHNELKNKEALLESPVPSRHRLMVESKISQLLLTRGTKDVRRHKD